MALLFSGSILWSLMMTLSAAVALIGRGFQDDGQIRAILAFYLAGGALAWLAALPVAAWLTRGNGVETRFSAYLFGLASASIGFTSLSYALHHRAYFAQWHEPAFSVPWFFQFGFTVAGGLYQFAVMGIGLFLPIGLPALFAASLWLARRPR